MRYLFFILSLLSLTCCHREPDFPHENEGFWAERIDAEELSRIILTYANELRHEKFLRLEDSKVSYDRHINIVHLEFITQNILELREARELLVDIVEGLLDRLNNDPEIASNMLFPLTADNLEIFVNFESYFVEYDDQFYMGWMSVNRGVSYFYAADIKQFDDIDWWHYRSEWYYKSRQFVEIERAAEEGYQLAHPSKEAKALKVLKEANINTNAISNPNVPQSFRALPALSN